MYNMSGKYQIAVFGKSGCPKCELLNKRIDKLLKKDDWEDFEKKYYSVETVDGLVAFSESECLNPQRIPAFVLMEKFGEDGWRLMENRRMGEQDDVCGKSKLYQYLGLQTDYAEGGGGIVSAKMIESVLSEARQG